MILLSGGFLKYDPLRNVVSKIFFTKLKIVTSKIVYSKSLKRICHSFLWTMNVLKRLFSHIHTVVAEHGFRIRP